jgi:DNA-binding XRE family transcriptional regulator
VKAQIIEKDGMPEWAIIPYAEYERLCEVLEDAEDKAAIERHIRARAAQEEEMVPSEIAERLLEGKSAIKVWREYRHLTQHSLASATGISKAYLSQLEAGEREGTVKVLKAIANALNVDLDDITG